MVKNAGRLLLIRIFCIVLTVFAINLFSFVFEKALAFFIFSAIVTLIYVLYITSVAHYSGTKDKRYNRFAPLDALAESALSEIPTAALLIWTLFSGAHFKLANIIYVIWQSPFWSVLAPGGDLFDAERVKPVYFIALIFIPLLYTVSYYIGGKTAKILTPENTHKK